MRKRKKQNNPAGSLVAMSHIQQLSLIDIPPFINHTRVYDADTDSVSKIITCTRQSMEYKQYMRYLKQNLNFNRCMYLSQIANTPSSPGIANVQIEIHHTPFKLDEIIRTICNKHIIDHGFADEFEVADEVVQLHYRHLIGLVPLSHSVHELIHHDAFDVHPALTYGFWKQWIIEYQEYFSESAKLCFDRLKEWEHTNPGQIPQSLEVKYTVIDYQGIPLYQTKELTDQEIIQKQFDTLYIAA